MFDGPATPPNDGPGSASAFGLRLRAGLGAGRSGHEGPSGAWTFDAFVAARRSWAGPSARLSARHFRSELETSDGKQARFRGYGLRLEACPFVIGRFPWFVEPCAGIDGGFLRATGLSSDAVVRPRQSSRAFWDVVLLARAGTFLSNWLLLEGQAELALSLVSYRYGFGAAPSGNTVFNVPRLAASARLGVGFQFR
jgi:hypothetical protein